MAKEKAYPKDVHEVVTEILCVIQNHLGCKAVPDIWKLHLKIDPLVFCFMAKRTKKLRKQIILLESRRIPGL